MKLNTWPAGEDQELITVYASGENTGKQIRKGRG